MKHLVFQILKCLSLRRTHNHCSPNNKVLYFKTKLTDYLHTTDYSTNSPHPLPLTIYQGHQMTIYLLCRRPTKHLELLLNTNELLYKICLALMCPTVAV